MKLHLRHTGVLTIVILLGFAAEFILAAESITPAPAFSVEELTTPQDDGWFTNGGTLDNQRYSPLSVINRDNVSELKGARRIGVDSALEFRHNNQAQPIVHEGVIYIITSQSYSRGNNKKVFIFCSN